MHCGENRQEDMVDMVEKWNKLGFIKPVKKDNVTFFLEKERNLRVPR
jgi:hypothetical protein